MKAVIIGNGAAAIGAIEAIREKDGGCEITVLAKESEPAYTPCFLAQYVAGEVGKEKLYMRPADFYEKNRINTLLGVSANEVDTVKNEVRLSSGKTLPYDRLLLAAGSSPIVPNIEGIKGKGVFYFRSLADSNLIKKGAKSSKKAVIMGAGFIGLEIAEVLSKLGLEVKVVEKEDRILPRMLDSEIAGLVGEHLRKNAIGIFTGNGIKRINRERSGGIKGVSLDNGKDLACDILIVSVGVKPNLEMLKSGSLKTNMGVLVNETMQTSVPNIYAAGDIAEIEIGGVRKVNPIHVNAVKSGHMAGINIAGVEKGMGEHVDDMNVVTLFGLQVLSLGVLSGPHSHKRSDSSGLVKIHESEKGLISGVQLLGDVTRGGLYLSLMKRGISINDQKGILSPRFNYGLTLKAA